MLKRSLSLNALIAGLAIAGCGVPGKVTGGGSMHSAGGAGRATFTFQADSCREGVIRGMVNFLDLSAIDFEEVGGVKLHGDVTDTYFCSSEMLEEAPPCSCDVGFQQVLFTYSSTNPRARGDGEGIACLADFGEGRAAGVNGVALISVSTGPFAGYYNAGSLSGNVQQHECD